MIQSASFPVYSLTISACTTWLAHSLSNEGTNGSNRLQARRQFLADGTETDACTGSIAKHHHYVLLGEYLESLGVGLCPACAERNGRHAAALVGRPGYEKLRIDRVIRECGLCDAHGFTVMAKNDSGQSSFWKDSLFEYGMALAITDQHAESLHQLARSGESKAAGKMIMTKPARSGVYALCIRYSAVGVGMDTYKWRFIVRDAAERKRRHEANLSALRDQIVSPEGAQTAIMLPHLAGARGAIVVRTTAGRAPYYSALDPGFVAHLMAMADDTCSVMPFETVEEFWAIMNRLIAESVPSAPMPPKALPARPRASRSEPGRKKENRK